MERTKRQSSRTVVPVPAVDRYAAWTRTEAYMPGRRIVIEAHQLRHNMRIGRRVLTGATAVRAVVDRTTHESRWEPVSLRKPGVKLDGVCWFTRCDCGIVRPTHVTSLICGNALSCGCFRTERISYETARRRETRTAEAAERELAAAYEAHAAEDRRIAREANRIAAARTPKPVA